MRRVLTVVVVCLLAAHARAGNKQEAAKLFDEGRELVAQARFAEACERFAQSNELERAAGTELNLGDCQEHLGHLAEAWRWFDDAATLWEQDEHEQKRATYAHNRAATVEVRLATIIVKLPRTDGVVVTISGRRVEAAVKIREHVDPGTIVVHVEQAGAPPFESSEALGAGETTTVQVDAPAGSAPEAPPAPAPTSHRHGWRLAFWGSAVVAVTGVGFFFYGKSQIDDAEDQLCRGGAYPSRANCGFPVTLTEKQLVFLNDQGDSGRNVAIAGEIAAVLAGGFAVVSLYEGYLKNVTVAPMLAPGGGGGAALGFTW